MMVWTSAFMPPARSPGSPGGEEQEMSVRDRQVISVAHKDFN